MGFRVLGYHVLVERLTDKKKVVGGLEINEDTSSDERYFRGKIISVGDTGKELLKEGEIARYDKMAGHRIEIEGKFYTMLKLTDIVLIE